MLKVKNMKHRDMRVDTLRGIACILLVTMHVIGYNATSGIQVADDSIYRWYTESFVYIRMPLFSFLAGLVYAWRPLVKNEYGQFMSKKFRRLLIPYFIFVLLIGLLQSIFPGSNNPTNLAIWEWFIYSLSPYWFLIATFWIFAYISYLDMRGLLKKINIVFLLLSFFIAINVFLQPSDWTFLQIGSAVTLFPFFLAGLMVHRFNWSTAPRWLFTLVTIICIALFIYTQAGVLGYLPIVSSRGDFIGILLGIAFPMVILTLSFQSKFLSWIGNYSSGIFLLHSFFVVGMRVLLKKIGVDDHLVLFIICSLSGIFGSMIGINIMRKFTVGRIAIGEK